MISPECGHAIAQYARRSDDGLETGGALFGVDRADGVLELRHATDAGPNAVRRRDYFLRDLAYTEREADRLFALDGSEWVGEWHTHLGAALIPSVLDMTTYQRHLVDSELGFSRFAAVIVGTDQRWGSGMLWDVQQSFAIGWEIVLR